jgi:RHS repeat-associated protein
MHHTATNGSWTRVYTYNEGSLLETGKQNNRLTHTQVGNGSKISETYSYSDAQGNDIHGCMTAINSMMMIWDFEDQLQQVDLGGGGTAYYVYDAAGQRVRKVIHRQNGTKQKERLYLGGFEIYREYNGSGATTPVLERETLHLMDDQQRLALVETKTIDTQSPGSSPQSLTRYQFSNHLGSASLELDDQAQIISYEEYTPYGSTSYQAVRSQTETPKHYRYTGKERDEESGLYYHGARYYAAWLGRWTSVDPGGLIDGPNLFEYARCNPTNLFDRTGLEGKPVEASAKKPNP